MRVCPTLEGNAIPLISHRIGEDLCAARQCGNYHKCHRCVYRGQPAGWEPAEPRAAVEVPATQAARRNGVASAPESGATVAAGTPAAPAPGKSGGQHRGGKTSAGSSPDRPANTKTRPGAAGKRLAARDAAVAD